MNNNICSICKTKNFPVDFARLKERKIINFINTNRINKDDYSIMIKKCNCNKKAHKFCVLLNILFNYELKCPDCNTFYNIAVTKIPDNGHKCQIISLLVFLIFIHIILYGVCAGLVLFHLEDFKMTDFKTIDKDKLLISQFFFALILFVLNSYLLYKSIKSAVQNFKFCYKYFININENGSKTIDDKKFFSPLFGFYVYFNKDMINNLVYKRNATFLSNKINYNKEFQNMFKKNRNEYKSLLNGNGIKEYNNKNDKDEILKLKNSYSKNNNLINEEEKDDNTNRVHGKKETITFGNINNIETAKEEEKN